MASKSPSFAFGNTRFLAKTSLLSHTGPTTSTTSAMTEEATSEPAVIDTLDANAVLSTDPTGSTSGSAPGAFDSSAGEIGGTTDTFGGGEAIPTAADSATVTTTSEQPASTGEGGGETTATLSGGEGTASAAASDGSPQGEGNATEGAAKKDDKDKKDDTAKKDEGNAKDNNSNKDKKNAKPEKC